VTTKNPAKAGNFLSRNPRGKNSAADPAKNHTKKKDLLQLDPDENPSDQNVSRILLGFPPRRWILQG